jgi:hypothetical protein
MFEEDDQVDETRLKSSNRRESTWADGEKHERLRPRGSEETRLYPKEIDLEI